MKFQLAKYFLLVAAFGLASHVVDAQTRKKTTRSTTAKKTTTKKTKSNTGNANLTACCEGHRCSCGGKEGPVGARYSSKNPCVMMPRSREIS